MSRALRAEWTKLFTLPQTGWLVLALIVPTVALSATAAAAVTCSSAACGLDPARISLTGIYLGQAAVVILAVLTLSGEYGCGMIRTTLAAMPDRITVLAAKAAVVTGVVLTVGTVSVIASVVAGHFILPANGFTAAHGNAPLPLASATMLRAAGGSVLYLALIALLSLGAAAAIRDPAAAIGVVLGLLYIVPVVAAVVTDPTWRERLQQLAPMSAGLAIQDTIDLRNLPIGPWAGLGVLCGWAAAALILGGLLLWRRDA